MEEEAPVRRSVAELAGRFKSSASPHDAAGNETKPVRRRPPRTLQIAKPQEEALKGDEQEQPPGVTSAPAKAKRHSAAIEKLQANLVLSPQALLPSPKSPGFRPMAPTFSIPGPTVTTSSTGSPASPVTSSPQEEGPTSFEAPLTVEEGSLLSSINKNRARFSIRRRPPSRHHRKSSSGDEVSGTNNITDTTLSSQSEADGKTTTGGEGEVFKEEEKTDEVKEDKDKVPTNDETRGDAEKNEAEEESSPGNKKDEDQEKKQEEASNEGATNTEGQIEKSEETRSLN
ncbi:duboraya isoform X2 [Mastacembelus armatus]|uniref:duboraya isoform X2 n=1 Tax=Mastacembelus armatus TaxID=205130 RepID=UPI000E45795A|nr:capZ-interacting protein-like isoform X2 [Mastacembelus armatus]